MFHTQIVKHPSIAQLVERWTVVGKHMTDIHRSLVRIRFEGVFLPHVVQLIIIYHMFSQEKFKL